MSVETDASKAGSPERGMPRLATILLASAAALAILLLMREFAGIIGPVFFALNLVITAYPLHTWLVSRGAPTWLAAIVMMLTVFAILLVMVAGLVWSVTEMVNILPQYSNEFTQLYQWALATADRFGVDQAALESTVGAIDPNKVVSAATSLLTGASGFLGTLAVIVMAIFFMAMDTPGFGGRMRRVMRLRPTTAEAMGKFAVGVRRYWLVTTIFGLLVAVLDGIALVILGVPLAMVWTLFSFLTNYIPNIGFIIGVIPPALVAGFANGWQSALLVIILYSVLNFVMQSLIQPRFTGESVGVTTTVSFVSLLLWSAVLGGIGSLIALPMTLLVKALLIDVDPKARWAGVLFASNPEDSDDDDR